MKTNIILPLLFFSVLTLACVGKEAGPGSTILNARFAGIKETIVEKIDKGEIPSMSVAVAENGKIIWMESFGWSDKENRIKATPETLYSIASLSKTLTATGIMKLSEKGLVDLDQDIQTYFGEPELKYYVESDKKVSCRHLLTHTSGLQMHFNYFYDDEKETVPPVKQVVERYGFIVTQPSSKFSYANLGYGILGEVISETTGRDFNEFMTEEIFLPLGMTQTTLDISSQTKKKLAKRYDFSGSLLPFSFSDTPGAGNASSTVKDLIHFGMFHLGQQSGNQGSVLSRTTIESMQRGQYPDNSNNRNNCGLGWWVEDNSYKYKMIFHAGGMDGVESMLRLLPQKDIAVVAIVNQSTANADLTDHFTEIILNELVPDLKEKDQSNNASETPTVKGIQQKDLLGRWNGFIDTHDEKIPLSLVIQEDGDIHVYDNEVPFMIDIFIGSQGTGFQHGILLNKLFFYDGRFMGWYTDSIPSEDTKRCSHITMLDLKYDSGKIKGTAAALANSNRMYFGISHYVELERVENE